MQHQRRVGRRMDLRQPFDVEPRSLLVEAVGRTDRHGQRIDAGRFDEPCGLFGRGEASALRLSQFGDVAQLRFDVHAVGACQFDDPSGRRDVLVERTFAGIDHHRVESCIETPLDQFDRSAVVEMNPPFDAVVGDRPAAHSDGLFEPHIVDRAARELQQHGSLHSLRSLHDGREGLEVIEIGRQHGRPVALAFFQQFFYVHYSRLLRSTRLNA